ncbi:conserved hypothetical protein [Ancylobacter novellus DSM 506]|uniref:Uncharacterized protein n=1 Tax=Ancylobacter novellus (strain ATCC 8093 / DSM 506 / JCM 20403 / CCM 1077 / IAM 12100 / NBRC 12443 / NCIMB 10456) TaxID=639283 RepID=D6ZZM7_ANCN5|nr:phage holin family protein [Ancylobacter novellus]ADH91222.1 conserved hypothetical protein [Ancylobacter novellus DSM 506]
MLRLLLGLVGAELRFAVRRATTTAILLAIGVLLISVSLFALLVAVFILLAERYDPATSALIIFGFTLVVGLIFLVVALMRTRRRPAPLGYGAYPGLGAVPPVTPPPGPAPPPKASTVLTIAAGAALIGLILGRRV